MRLNVNGFEYDAAYDERDLAFAEKLLGRWTEMRRGRKDRLIVFLAGAPGTGKSTLGLFLEAVSREKTAYARLDCRGTDGFHYPNAYLEEHTVLADGEEVSLRRVKGSPESFDTERMRTMLARVRTEDIALPVYSRLTHEPEEGSVPVAAPVLLFEGNYLLLDRPEWRSLPCDDRILLTGLDEDVLLRRVAQRKVRGGMTEEEALAFVRFNDRRNIRICENESGQADLTLITDERGHIAFA